MSEGIMKKIQEQAAYWAQSSARFVDDSVVESIATYDRAKIDELPHGVIKLDDEGKVLIFNRHESEKSGVAISDAEGKLFFSQVAPCTNNAIFLGSFQKGVSEGKMDLIFPYTFTYKMKPTPVKVHLYRKEGSSDNWVFVKWS
ncbi:MAG: photoactive yellow protein [Leptospiraceae bacterium]|nr:photoactive yellow protein [Leptospiraceae bacterium]